MSKNCYGWLIYNKNLENHINMYTLYKEAAKTLKINLELIPNTDITPSMSTEGLFIHHNHAEPDFIIFLDKDTRLAKHLELLGYKVFNSSNVIALCDDKMLTNMLLSYNNIPTAKTIFPHFLYQKSNNDDEYIDFLEQSLGYPMIIKEAYGSFGKQVYLANNREELSKIRDIIGLKPHLYQEFINTSYGKDVRAYIVGDEVVACVLRTSNGDFRSNLHSGGSMSEVKMSDDFRNIALKASSIIGADFCGIDILFGENGTPIVCEINSSSHIQGIFDLTGINVSEYILKYIKNKLS